jgi:hypothetical protein
MPFPPAPLIPEPLPAGGARVVYVDHDSNEHEAVVLAVTPSRPWSASLRLRSTGDVVAGAKYSAVHRGHTWHPLGTSARPPTFATPKPPRRPFEPFAGDVDALRRLAERAVTEVRASAPTLNFPLPAADADPLDVVAVVVSASWRLPPAAGAALRRDLAAVSRPVEVQP